MPVDRRPFPLHHLLPAELRDVILDFHWDAALLWELDLPLTSVPVAELSWHLELPFWAYEGEPFVLTPLQVGSDPKRYVQQYERTMMSDLAYPMHVLARPSGSTILDGVHRLLKANILGHEMILVRTLGTDRLDEIASTFER